MRTVVEPHNGKDRLIAEQICGYLTLARQLLETSPESIIEAAAYLNLADRYIVWLYPRDCLRPETEKVVARLEHFKPIGWESFRDAIRKCGDSLDGSDLDPRRAALDVAIAAVNEAIVEDRISTHLQIRCLGHFSFGGLCLLVVLFLASPFALNLSAIKQLPSIGPSWAHPFTESLTLALAICLIGALGGFLSAIMDARRIKMTIDVYEERWRLLQIKPLVGALVSLVLLYLLSWDVVPAISPQNVGSYSLVAFLSGFSEKYFLRLLPLDPDDNELPRGRPHGRPSKTGQRDLARGALAAGDAVESALK